LTDNRGAGVCNIEKIPPFSLSWEKISAYSVSIGGKKIGKRGMKKDEKGKKKGMKM
jgi:hypothetical protein